MTLTFGNTIGPVCVATFLLVLVSRAQSQERILTPERIPDRFIEIEKSKHDQDEVDFTVRIKDNDGDGSIKIKVKLGVEDEESDELNLRLVEHSTARGVVQAIIHGDTEIVLRLDVGGLGLLQALQRAPAAASIIKKEREIAQRVQPRPQPEALARKEPVPPPENEPSVAVIQPPPRKAPNAPEPNPSQVITTKPAPSTLAKKDSQLPTTLEPTVRPKQPAPATQPQPKPPVIVATTTPKRETKPTPKPPAPKPVKKTPEIVFQDVDKRQFAVNKHGKVSFVMICSADTETDSRAMGTALNTFAAIPQFQNPVIVELTESMGSFFKGMTISSIKNNLNKEAEKLREVYKRVGNPNNPRDEMHTVADFEADVTKQLGYNPGVKKIKGILYDVNGNEVMRWDPAHTKHADIVRAIKAELKKAGVDLRPYQSEAAR